MKEIKYCDKGFLFTIKEGCKLKHYPKRKTFGQYAVCSKCAHQRVIDFDKVERVKIYLGNGKFIERAMKVDKKDSDERDRTDKGV